MKSVEEFSVKTLEIAGLVGVLEALRLPFGKDCRSVTAFSYNAETNGDIDYHSQILNNSSFEKDLTLMSTLFNEVMNMAR